MERTKDPESIQKDLNPKLIYQEASYETPFNLASTIKMGGLRPRRLAGLTSEKNQAKVDS